MGRLGGWLLCAALTTSCDPSVDAEDTKAYFEALVKQTDYLVEQANGICADSSTLSQHGAIQGLLRDLNQYRIDFEGQLRCTDKGLCAPPNKKATAPPVFRAEPGAPDPQGAQLSKDTFAKLRKLMDGKPPRPLRQALISCQTDAMAVAASTAVLVTTCTTQPGSAAHQREAARLAEAQREFAAAMSKARSAVP